MRRRLPFMYYDEIKVDGNVPERSLFMRKFCLSQFIIIKKTLFWPATPRRECFYHLAKEDKSNRYISSACIKRTSNLKRKTSSCVDSLQRQIFIETHTDTQPKCFTHLPAILLFSITLTTRLHNLDVGQSV